MKTLTKTLFICLIGILVLVLSGCGENPADLVIKNAEIVTIDKENPRAEAVAFFGEKIIAVTTNKKINQYIDEETTKVLDAKGRLVFPGFNDAHAHFGPVDIFYIELRYITDPNIITEKVKEMVAVVNPGELITGGGWEHEMFTDRQWPTKELIDEVAPDNPVLLYRADYHSVLVNSYVLENSGITKDTPDPFGGEIQKDPETGEPTGILKETARGLIITGEVTVERTPEEIEELFIQGWEAAFDMAARLGVTSIQHPGDGNAETYQRFMDEGKLTFRVDVAGRLTNADEEQLLRWDTLRNQYPPEGNWIRFGYLKTSIDGTLGSATALFFEPFEDEPDKTGLPRYEIGRASCRERV